MRNRKERKNIKKEEILRDKKGKRENKTKKQENI